MNKNSPYFLFYRLMLALVAAIGWVAVLVQLFNSIDRSHVDGLSIFTSVVRYISYFTFWINSLIAFLLTFYALLPESRIKNLRLILA